MVALTAVASKDLVSLDNIGDIIVVVNQLSALANELKTVQATNRTLLNELKADYNATLAKLDADATVTDTNYAATNAAAAADIAAITSPNADTITAPTY